MAKKKVKSVKKTVKTKKTKKTTKRKKSGKKVEVSIFRQINKEIPEELHFILNDGRRIKSVFEFIDMLDNIDDELFNYHANEHKNDFANWIRNACNEERIAEEIVSINSRLEAQNKLLKYLVNKLK